MERTEEIITEKARLRKLMAFTEKKGGIKVDKVSE